jgi:hypothetical protein
MQAPLSLEDVAWVSSYADRVRVAYERVFASEKDRFQHGSLLLDRFQRAIDEVLTRGRGNFSSVDEAHNEICIAAALLAHTSPRFSNLAYEPTLPNTKKTIDFRAETDHSEVLFVDVKSIMPSPHKDGWPRYERAVRDGWLDENSLDLEKESLGGELSHSRFTSRERFLEYTLELESKITESDFEDRRTSFALAFCGTGFDWEKHELEDFVSFYFSGSHRADDLFGAAELHDMNLKTQSFSGAIDLFACMFRRRGNPHSTCLSWCTRRSATA